MRSTDEAVIQYNEIYDTKGKMDGQAFDADLEAYRTLVQYNYSRNNEGGFMLVYGSGKDAIVRYNVSQDDGRLGKHLLDFPVWTTPRGSGIFHNNVFYIGPGNDAVLVDEALSTAKVYNNIVINEGAGKLYIPSEGKTAGFSNNCLVGYSGSQLSVNANPVGEDHHILNPGAGGEGFNSLEVYMIGPESTCIEAGLAISEMEGDYWLKDTLLHDFYRNPVGPFNVDVGIHQLSEPNTGNAVKNGRTRWQIYPVPFSNQFKVFLSAGNDSDFQISLFSEKGKLVEELYSGRGNENPGVLTFNLDSHLEPGPYILKLKILSSGYEINRMIIKI